jgi:hypothetical protein
MLCEDHRVGAETTVLAAQWESGVHLALLSYEEAYQRSDVQPSLSIWISFAQNAALGAHTLTGKDGPETAVQD